MPESTINLKVLGTKIWLEKKQNFSFIRTCSLKCSFRPKDYNKYFNPLDHLKSITCLNQKKEK